MTDEATVRAMRDRIYGKGSDRNWSNIRENWMKPENIKWLSDAVRREELNFATGTILRP